MLDIAFIRQNPAVVSNAATHKNVAVDINRLLELDTLRRTTQTELDNLRHERKQLSGKSSTKPSPAELAAGKKIKQELSAITARLAEIDLEYEQLLSQVPNIPSADTPVGTDASANKVLRQVGVKPSFSFPPKEHWQLGTALDIIDNERASRVAGARFTYLKGAAAQLEFALLQFALSILTSEPALAGIISHAGLNVPPTPFRPIIPPVFIKPDVFQKMARLEPRDDRYYIASDDLYLIGSAEHTLGAMHMDETLAAAALPLRYVGFSTSFRREAGSYGKDTRGILRVHQFDKLEMESFTTADASLNEQNFIVAIQEHLMSALGIPYQVVHVCTGDMGAPDVRQIDIESWLPGQNQYRETQTSDLIGEYQARRLKTKVKQGIGQTEFVHMNDATAFAMGRTIIAILENYQQADGSIKVPDVLHPYLPFTTITVA